MMPVLNHRADGPVSRAFWRAVVAAGRRVGPRRGRRLAVGLLRARSLTDAGYDRAKLRMVWRDDLVPGIVKIPKEWAADDPLVSCRRMGLRVDLDLRDNLQRTLYFTGRYEPSLFRLFRRELRKGDVFVDVGAHIGLHSMSAARRLRRLGGGRVIAFEPTADSAAAIRRLAGAHGVEVTVVHAALGAGEGEVEIRSDPDYDDADAGVRSQFAAGEVVARAPITTFDRWAAGEGLDRADIVKIDVEGAESAVLEGMQDSMARYRPRLVVAELKERIMQRARVEGDDVRRLLASAGYRAVGRLEENEVFRPD